MIWQTLFDIWKVKNKSINEIYRPGIFSAMRMLLSFNDKVPFPEILMLPEIDGRPSMIWRGENRHSEITIYPGQEKPIFFYHKRGGFIFGNEYDALDADVAKMIMGE